MNKLLRQSRIREIIETEYIETQEELTAALRDVHIDVTQATVSRDIKEMHLVKVSSHNGKSRYAYPETKVNEQVRDRLTMLFKNSVQHLEFSENIIVVKTLPGAANAVAAAIDGAHWPEIIGTVAGDDNIFIVVKPKEVAREIKDKLEAYII